MPRDPLSRDRVIAAAVELADAEGLGAVTMNAVGARLGVRGMSLYHHVAGKEAMLDGMVDSVFAEVHLPAAEEGWREGMRRRAVSARTALSRHPWAVGLLDSRTTPGPATLAHHDAVLGCLRGNGFDVATAALAFAVLDSYIYGFALQEVSLPFDSDADLAEEPLAHDLLAAMPEGTYPHLVEAAGRAMTPGYAFADEFEPGLDLVIIGLSHLIPDDTGARLASTWPPPAADDGRERGTAPRG